MVVSMLASGPEQRHQQLSNKAMLLLHNCTMANKNITFKFKFRKTSTIIKQIVSCFMLQVAIVYCEFPKTGSCQKNGVHNMILSMSYKIPKVVDA